MVSRIEIPNGHIVQDCNIGVKRLNSMDDKIKYPDAKAMIDEVHDLGYKIDFCMVKSRNCRQ